MSVRHALSVAGLLLASASGLTAQVEARRWFARAEGGWVSFGDGASTEAPAPDELASFGPGANVRYGLALGRRVGPVEIALSGRHGGHALEARADDVAVSLEPGYSLTTVALTAAYPVARTSTGARLEVFAGPTLDLWSGDVVPETRARLGGTGGVGIVAPLGSRIALDVHGALRLAGSPVTEEDLAGFTSDYDVGAMLSRELGLGLRLLF